MIIMLYRKAAANNEKLKYLKINRKKKGIKQKTLSQLKKGSQFFRVLNTLSRAKNSLKISPTLGLIKLPSSSFQP